MRSSSSAPFSAEEIKDIALVTYVSRQVLKDAFSSPFHFAAFFAEEIKKVQAKKAEEIKKLGSERVVELLRTQICLNEAKNELLHLTVEHAISGPTACRSFIEIFLKLAHRDLFADHTTLPLISK